MATDVERLVVQLSADFKQYQNALNRATGVTNRSARQIESRFAQMNRNVSSGFLGLSRGMVTALAAGASVRGAQTLIDTSVRIQNALKVTGLEGEALAAVYDDLFASAQKNFAPLESLVSLYSRIGLAQNELGVSTQEIVGFTDKIALALRVQGTTALEARGALLQLSQALAGGVVRAEEFNSIIEGAPSILRAAAAGIKEADGSVAKLRQIMLDGELSSQAFFRGIEAGSHILEDQLAGAETTVSAAFIRLQNVLVDAAGKLNQGTDASRTLAGAIEWVADTVASADFGPFIEGLERVANTASEVIGFVDRLGAALGSLTGLDQVGPALRNRVEQSGINERLDAAFAGAAPKGGRPTALPSMTVRPSQISAADYPVGSGIGQGNKGGSGGKSTRERADEYQRLAERIDQSTASLIAETEAQRQMNPLVEDYGYTLEKARAEQDLLNAAKEAGKEITPQLRGEISALAEQYALATMEAGKLAETQDEIRERAEDMRDFQKDLSRGIVEGFMQGKDAAEVFSEALNKISSKLLDMAFDGLFDSKSGGGGILGAIGKLFGFANGGYTGPGGKNQPAGVVHKGEYVFSKASVDKIGLGNLDALHRGYANGGPVGISAPRMPRMQAQQAAPVAISYSPTIDARGADTAAVARLEQVIANDRKQFEARVTATVRKLPSNRMGK